jgi:hypothetical protein
MGLGWTSGRMKLFEDSCQQVDEIGSLSEFGYNRKLVRGEES